MKEIQIKSKKHLLEILKSMISDEEVLDNVIPNIDENIPSNISYSEETIKPAKKEKTKKLKVVKPKSKSVKLKEKPSSKKTRIKKS